jgi:hypothetical protein
MPISRIMQMNSSGFVIPTILELWTSTNDASLSVARDTMEFAVIPKQDVTITEMQVEVNVTSTFQVYQDNVLIDTLDSDGTYLTIPGISISVASNFTIIRTAGVWNYPYSVTPDTTTDVIVGLNTKLTNHYYPVVTLFGYFNSASIGNPVWAGNLTGANIASSSRSAYSTTVTISTDVRLIAVRTGIINSQSDVGLANFYLEIDSVQVGPVLPGYGFYCYTPVNLAYQELSAGAYNFVIRCDEAVRNRFWVNQSAGWTDAPFTTGAWAQAPTHGVWMEFLYI